MTQKEKEMFFALQTMILDELNLEFKNKELTGSLRMSIKPDIMENGIAIEIPAPRYSKKIYLEKGYIQFTGKGSYASQIDRSGSWYHNHQDYLNNCIGRALKKWMEYYHIKAKMKDEQHSK